MPFATPYQRWYSEVKVLIKQLLPDRLVDFVQHYEKPKSRTSEYLPITGLIDRLSDRGFNQRGAPGNGTPSIKIPSRNSKTVADGQQRQKEEYR